MVISPAQAVLAVVASATFGWIAGPKPAVPICDCRCSIPEGAAQSFEAPVLDTGVSTWGVGVVAAVAALFGACIIIALQGCWSSVLRSLTSHSGERASYQAPVRRPRALAPPLFEYER